jgi:hypothetical protein
VTTINSSYLQTNKNSTVNTRIHHSTVLLALVATHALPSPALGALISARDTSETDLVAESIVFGVQCEKCRIPKCAKVIATAGCTFKSLPDVSETLECVSGNAEAVSTNSSLIRTEREKLHVHVEHRTDHTRSCVLALAVSTSTMIGSLRKGSVDKMQRSQRHRWSMALRYLTSSQPFLSYANPFH